MSLKRRQPDPKGKFEELIKLSEAAGMVRLSEASLRLKEAATNFTLVRQGREIPVGAHR